MHIGPYRTSEVTGGQRYKADAPSAKSLSSSRCIRRNRLLMVGLANAINRLSSRKAQAMTLPGLGWQVVEERPSARVCLGPSSFSPRSRLVARQGRSTELHVGLIGRRLRFVEDSRSSQ